MKLTISEIEKLEKFINSLNLENYEFLDDNNNIVEINPKYIEEWRCIGLNFRGFNKRIKEKFYLYEQNNSGGNFTVNNKLCHKIIIEASNIKEANIKGLGLGMYFNGCESGIDCKCCGNRWYGYPDELEFPYSFSKDIILNNELEYLQYLLDNYGFFHDIGRVFYKSGIVKELKSNKL